MKLRMKVAVGALGALGGVAVLSSVALAGSQNLPPTCQDDTFDIAAGVALEDGVADLCNDPNPQTILSFGVGTNHVANGTLDFDEESGDFLYTPNPGFSGTDDFSFFADDGFVIPSAVDDAVAADVSAPAVITINVAAAQVSTTTTTSTTVAVAPTSVTAAPTTVLARTGDATTTTAGGGLLTIGLGLGLVAASGALVTRARKT